MVSKSDRVCLYDFRESNFNRFRYDEIIIVVDKFKSLEREPRENVWDFFVKRQILKIIQKAVRPGWRTDFPWWRGCGSKLKSCGWSETVFRAGRQIIYEKKT